MRRPRSAVLVVAALAASLPMQATAQQPVTEPVTVQPRGATVRILVGTTELLRVLPDTVTLPPDTVTDTLYCPISGAACSKAVVVRPGESIQAAVTASPAGTTFRLAAGRHVRQSVTPKTADTFRCEMGAVLDGRDSTLYAFDGVVKPYPSDVRIVGCRVVHYAPPVQKGAIRQAGWSAAEGGSGWVLDSVQVDSNANLGVRLGERGVLRNSQVRWNKTLGVGGVGNDMLVENTEIAFNNPDTTGNLDFESGGTKFVLTKRLVLRNNFVHHNGGPGLWLDIDNDSSLVEGNRVEDNVREGIATEISYQATIRGNTVRRNGLADVRRTRWLWGAGIGVHGSQDVEITGNTLDGNAHGVVLIQQRRACGVGGGRCPHGPYVVQHVWVHDNQVTQGVSGAAGGAVQDLQRGDTTMYAQRDLRWDRNAYRVDPANRAPFAWQNNWRSWPAWRAAGQDRSGQLTGFRGR